MYAVSYTHLDVYKRQSQYQLNKFAIAGGVASNTSLRAAFEKACREKGLEFYHPSPVYCTDNAAMIGVAGYYEYCKGTRHGWDLNAVPNLKLDVYKRQIRSCLYKED